MQCMFFCVCVCRKMGTAERADEEILMQKPRNRVCIHCGKVFSYTNNRQVMCSVVCRDGRRRARRKAKLTQIACLECGELFWPPTPRIKICSQACRTARNVARNKTVVQDGRKKRPASRGRPVKVRRCIECGNICGRHYADGTFVGLWRRCAPCWHTLSERNFDNDMAIYG